MFSFNLWNFRQLFRKVWIRVLGFALLAVVSAALAQILSPYLPEMLTLKLGSNAVTQILNVLASSLLAVTTFSLSIAVSALATASGSATPRTTVLLQSDRTTQNVLATFIGAFLFSLLGLIALNAQLYSEDGKIILFLFTLVVVLLVIVALIRWIDHLMNYGRMGNTLDRVEEAAAAALDKRLDAPCLGGRPFNGVLSKDVATVRSRQTGYIQYINMRALQSCAERMEARLYLDRLPGAFVVEGGPLLSVDGAQPDEELIKAMTGAFSIGPERAFDEDPRFGLIVLSEIASRALSPAVNDPGTAISVLGRLVRVLSLWRKAKPDEPDFPDVHVIPVSAADIIEDAFRPIARDGAGIVEVQIRLQKSLKDLALIAPEDFRAPAGALSDYALERARAAGLLEGEIAQLENIAQSANLSP